MVKNPPAYAGDTRVMNSIPGVRKIPWNRKQQPTPVFLPGKFYGQRSLSGHSSWGHKKSETTEQLSTVMADKIEYGILESGIEREYCLS